MISYNKQPNSKRSIESTVVSEFVVGDDNIDKKTVESFGHEWERFNSFSEEEIKNAGDQYFDIIDFTPAFKNYNILDLGCGTGRWTKYLHNYVNSVEAVDPSEAIYQAASRYHNLKNVRFTRADIDNLPFEDESFDFVFSLGVLHHIPNTEKALDKLLKKLKPGGIALIYLYYALDNRGLIYRVIFKLSSLLRFIISSLPSSLKFILCDIIAVVIYYPFVLFSRLVKSIFRGKNWFKKIPLSYYHDKSWNIIRNDALDRFGTPLEQRYSRKQIKEMVDNCGDYIIEFSNGEPYWHFKLIKS